MEVKKQTKVICYRMAGSAVPGPDYVCSSCGVHGLRLWRQTNVFTDYIKLLCAKCAVGDQVEQIKEYSNFVRSYDPGIGNLVPARPTSEGDTFYGQTSGDGESVVWWYTLPQYTDPVAELERVRLERDHFVAAHQQALVTELKLWKRIGEWERKS